MLMNECTKPEKKVGPEDYNDEYGNVRWRVGAELDHGTYIGRLLRAKPDTTRTVAYTVRYILRGISLGLRNPVAPRVDELLDQLDVLRQARLTVEEETSVNVGRARDNGASWSQIGASLGSSKQAVQQKYGK